jgi:hypothetical protein
LQLHGIPATGSFHVCLQYPATDGTVRLFFRASSP